MGGSRQGPDGGTSQVGQGRAFGVTLGRLQAGSDNVGSLMTWGKKWDLKNPRSNLRGGGMDGGAPGVRVTHQNLARPCLARGDITVESLFLKGHPS